MDPDQTAPFQQTVWTQIRLLLKEQSDLGPHCLSLFLTLLINVGKKLQQTTKADVIFRCIFAGVIRVNRLRFCDS